MARPFKNVTFWDRVWVNTKITDKNCIEFTGCRDDCGYGRINRDGKLVRLHREVWRLNRGQISDGLCIRHKCDNPSCININHLEIGTQKDNVRDMILRGRRKSTAGQANPSAKLAERDVFSIKKKIRSGQSCYSIAREYGVKGETILHIKNGRNWRHIK